jgi:hypothetical protein
LFLAEFFLIAFYCLPCHFFNVNLTLWYFVLQTNFFWMHNFELILTPTVPVYCRLFLYLIWGTTGVVKISVFISWRNYTSVASSNMRNWILKYDPHVRAHVALTLVSKIGRIS